MFGIKGMPVPAGAENVAEQIGSRLVQRGHQVTVYVRKQFTHPSIREYKGMRLVHLPSIPTKHLDTITHSFFACFAASSSDADVVHIHSTGSSIYALLPRLVGKKTVVQSHGLDWQRAKWNWFAKMYLRLTDYSSIFFPNSLITVSKNNQVYYQTLTKRNIMHIPNGVSPSEKIRPNLIHKYGLYGDDYILFAARLVKEKGAHYLIEAYRDLNPKKKLILLGDGSYGDAYAKILRQQANDMIIFPGFVQGDLLSEFLSNCYLYVLPSEIEGMSIGLLQAMSYGNCALVSDLEENLEVIGDAGCVFRSKSVADLRYNMNTLLQNPDLVNIYRKKAISHIQSHFNWEDITGQFESLYKSLL
jgi:glycosyltransferase involved in cell wall biosynthesis